MEEENWREPNEHAGPWVKDKVGAHDARDRATGPDAGHGRAGIEHDVRQAGSEAAEQVEQQVAEMAEVVFDIVAEEPKHPHVAQHMTDRAMEKHRGENRHQSGSGTEHGCTSQQADFHARNYAELRDQRVQCAPVLYLKLPLEKINQQVQGDQKVRDEWGTESRLIIAKRKHEESGKLVVSDSLMNAVLIIDKAAGLTSHDVVDRVRRIVEQMPPPFSAKKIHGVPAYKLARKKKEVKLAPVQVTIHEFEIVSCAGDRAEFRARVASGTYMRSVAHDLGRELGCGGHLESL